MLFSRVTNWFPKIQDLMCEKEPLRFLVEESKTIKFIRARDGKRGVKKFILRSSDGQFCICRTDHHVWLPIDVQLKYIGEHLSVPVRETRLSKSVIKRIEPNLGEQSDFE